MVNFGNVKSSTFSVYDHDINLIKALTEYSFHLQFTKHKAEQLIDIVEQFKDYIQRYVIELLIFKMIDESYKMFK